MRKLRRVRVEPLALCQIANKWWSWGQESVGCTLSTVSNIPHRHTFCWLCKEVLLGTREILRNGKGNEEDEGGHLLEREGSGAECYVFTSVPTCPRPALLAPTVSRYISSLGSVVSFILFVFMFSWPKIAWLLGKKKLQDANMRSHKIPLSKSNAHKKLWHIGLGKGAFLRFQNNSATFYLWDLQTQHCL